MTTIEFKDTAIEMLERIIEEIRGGRARYVILGLIRESDEDELSICTEETEATPAAEMPLTEMPLTEMLTDIRQRSAGVQR